MEVLPCTNTQHAKQVENSDARMDELLLNADELLVDEHIEEEGTGNGLVCSEKDELNAQNNSILPCLSSNLVVDTVESKSPSNNAEGDSSITEPKWLQQDESVALWVKWRGKWQAGIRCERADWPLATLRGKPTHDRKKYFVIFFPHTKNYSWADMQFVLPINKFPEPIAYKTHKIGLKMINDLTAARRNIMRKLVVGMLNIVDQFHSEALVESSRDVLVWKEFAMEASRCSCYHHLGRMLLKLQSMILPRYINSAWLKHSFHSWVQKCNAAQSAERIELLKEELFDSILWNEVKSLLDASMQPTLFSDWKMWKHEVTRWFSISHSVSGGGEIEQENNDGFSNPDVQASHKRPKLEIRRAETHVSQMEYNGTQQGMAIEIDSDFFCHREGTSTIEVVKEGSFMEEDATMNTPKNGNRWGSLVVEMGGSEATVTKEVNTTVTPLIQDKDVGFVMHNNQVVAKKQIDSGNKSRQCIAFIESKGRQCVRWANEGDIYCCVHLASRFTTKPAKTEVSPSVETPMCGGITVLGTKCKHRSLPGSLFCKKHRPQSDKEKSVSSSADTVKRKLDEIISSSEATYCRDIVPVGESEFPPQVDSFTDLEGSASNEKMSFSKMFKHYNPDNNLCVGSYSQNNYLRCHETPVRYTLYCVQHLPSWLKRARNGKSRIISKEVFLDLLGVCSSRKEKLCLHQACEIFYKLFKSVLSLRNPVPMEVQFQWAISEASKYASVGEFLMKLVCHEKERLIRIWGFSADENQCISSSAVAASPIVPLATDKGKETKKIDEQSLFRGFACAICLDSFADRKFLETHVEERHHVQFVEKCMLLQCIPCGSHFGNAEQLLLHVQSVHPSEFKSNVAPQQNPLRQTESSQKSELGNSVSAVNQNSENLSGVRKFICKFCGLKFDLLPDLGRHHQAEHMGTNLPSSHPMKRGLRFHPYMLKSGRLSRPNRFKKGLGAVSYRIRNRANVNVKKRIQASKSSLGTEGVTGISSLTDTGTLGRLTDSNCSGVAKILFSKIQKTKPRPNNLDILSAARSACCKLSLKASLEAKFGILPERMYLKAAKLCSEHDIQVQWHQEWFVCPNGCKYFKDPSLLSPLVPRPNNDAGQQYMDSQEYLNNGLEVDECHCIIESHHFRERPLGKTIVLCNDISFGQELVPVSCVVDQAFLDSEGRNAKSLRPWESFSYVTKPMLDQSINLCDENLELSCGYLNPTCSPKTCDHVYLFNNDFEDAKDIYGQSMRCRFPYNDKGRIILEEGYPVYECNHMCSCNRACQNRVLQNGIHVKLEVFKTDRKGWGVRAVEPILRGTFICEYIGEVVDEQEANKRRSGYGTEGCSYMYNIDAHVNDISRLVEGEPNYVIDATMYGNVSRFINHSCSPNLATHQVLVESMESQRAHIGLFVCRDMATGEELTCDYRYKLMSGEGHPCLCGASNCRGRLC